MEIGLTYASELMERYVGKDGPGRPFFPEFRCVPTRYFLNSDKSLTVDYKAQHQTWQGEVIGRLLIVETDGSWESWEYRMYGDEKRTFHSEGKAGVKQ